MSNPSPARLADAGRTAIRERPLLMSGPMVRAILDGQKSQTRRVVTPDNSEFGAWGKAFWSVADLDAAWRDGTGSGAEYLKVPVKPGTAEMNGVVDRLYPRFGAARCWDQTADPEDGYTPPASRLWVRETWGHDWYDDGQTRAFRRVVYRADDAQSQPQDNGSPQPWKPSIHMPRRYSRITLEITAVRVERLRDISIDDCRAEGAPGGDSTNDIGWRYSFGSLWNSINEKRGYGWDANPWVWVIEFRRLSSTEPAHA